MLLLPQTKDQLQSPLTSKEKQEAKDLLDAHSAISKLFPNFKNQIKEHVGANRTDNLPRK